MARLTPSAAVLADFGLADARLERFPSGLINTTWHAILPDGEERVLQRVNAAFGREVNDDIDAVTRHLVARDIMTPVLIPATNGALTVVDQDGAVWRQITHIPGVTYDALAGEHQAKEAGALLGRFHRTVSDVEHEFSAARPGVHDTAKHLKNLLDALLEHAAHRRFDAIEPLATDVLELASAAANFDAFPDRVVHGDPKISNIVFHPKDDTALCLIDLDTLNRMPVVLELGDAFRSWCNPHAEDAEIAEFSLPFFMAAVTGYARETKDLLSEAEWRAIPVATFTITVELAARFCADALNESYFGWDDARFPNASAHNEARTRSQIALARSIAARRDAMETAVRKAFAARGG